MKGKILTAALLIFTLSACTDGQNDDDNTGPRPAPRISYSIVSSHPQDTSWFTQGYEFHNNYLIISTGNYGSSRLLQVDPATGQAVKQVRISDSHFGEGVTILNDTIYQLTWKEGVVHIYRAADLSRIGERQLRGDGWGLANDGQYLILSNGSNNLYFHEPGNFRLVRTQAVTDAGTPVVNLNELEFVNGYIYANQWQYNTIVKINPETGIVEGKLDFSDLVRQLQSEFPYMDMRTGSVLNGIAYNPSTGRFRITGKNWPRSYEIDFPH